MKQPTHYRKEFNGVDILHVGFCKECQLPWVEKVNHYYGLRILETIKLPELPAMGETCDGDCAS